MTVVTVRKLEDVRPPLLWEPTEGIETRRFVAQKSNGIAPEALSGVVFEAQQILGRCVNPVSSASEVSSSTGLVVGYVQSGKTLSFTTLCALAHDNGFGLVILIAGTLENLRRQTRSRLEVDLGIGDDANAINRPWLVVDNPAPGDNSAESLRRTLQNWSNPKTTASLKKVCLVVLLKQHKRLGDLGKCLEALGPGLLAQVPTLVIDDEADQASLNTFTAKNILKGTNRKSSNYANIVELKKWLPLHTYVQYTATPQANLLMDLADTLSPEFGELLTPGEGYVGGATIFEKGAAFSKSIPPSQAEAKPDEVAPATLQEALRYFLLGACAVLLSDKPALRTMMVHPSQQTGRHGAYLSWLIGMVTEWKNLTSSEVPAYLIETFADVYKGLQESVGSTLPPLNALIAKLPEVLRNVAVREVNSTATGASPIRWGESPFWVLVGGAKLDRGFTVEGLTVTYMPRPLATGNADSLQQRARFYGYKQRYLGYCRVYLLPDVLEAFQQYVEHEKDIHESLVATRGEPLKKWVRQFTLHTSMQPTRKGVVGIPMTELVSQGWMQARAAHRDPVAVASNQKTFAALKSYLDTSYPGVAANETYPETFLDQRPNARPNVLHESVPLDDLVDRLLRNIQTSDEDDEFERAGAILAIRRLIEGGQQFADVFVMGSFEPQLRSLTASGRINQVHQGHSKNYGGDKAFVHEERVTLHLRKFDLMDDNKIVVASEVPWYSIHIPSGLAKRYILQNEK
jgi:hypothetical protein